jgi:Ni/Co efflux regulator RcnB
MIRFAPAAILIAGLAFNAAPAFAQSTFQEPRFEGLEMQQQMLEQNRLDRLESQRVQEQARPLTNPNVSAADSAIRQLEIQRQMDQVRLQGREEREHDARQATIREQQLPNRRIAPSSILVVRDPYEYSLPPAPAGQYYARLDGRFVLVDRASELVVRVLDVRPADPTLDAPVSPRPQPNPPVALDRQRAPDRTDPPPAQPRPRTSPRPR